MSITNSELQQLRQAGLSDDQILAGVSKTDPEDVADIGSLQKNGLNSTQILNGFSQYEGQNGPQSSDAWIDSATNFIKAPVYGAEQELNRAASTEKNALGATGMANAEARRSANTWQCYRALRSRIVAFRYRVA